MKDDDDFLKPFKMRKEKQKQRNEFYKETMKRTAAYISLMMRQWQDMDCIFAPYHN
jgi:hypothetical protein